MPEPSISEFMSRMATAFIAEKAVGIDANIQLKLTGASAADWVVSIHDAKCTLTQGAAPAPKLTVSADSGDFVNIFTGRMDGMQAFMQGKLKITGDMGLAMKLMNMFNDEMIKE
jgi:putative sterol carrier protein